MDDNGRWKGSTGNLRSALHNFPSWSCALVGGTYTLYLYMATEVTLEGRSYKRRSGCHTGLRLIKGTNSSFLCNSWVHQPVCIIVTASTGDNWQPFSVPVNTSRLQKAVTVWMSVSSATKLLSMIAGPFLSLLLYCDRQEHWLWNVQVVRGWGL